MRKGWSLQRRLMLWFTAGVCGLFLLAVGFGAWQLNDALGYEMEGLIEEEFAEIAVECHKAPVNSETFGAFCGALGLQHQGFHLSWRAWLESESEPWCVAGAPPRIPFPERALETWGQTIAPEPGFRYRMSTIETRVLSPDDGKPYSAHIVLELLVDGAPRAGDMRATSALFLLLALVGAIVCIIGGAFVARRMATLLEEVARSAGAARLDSDAALDFPSNPPDEIWRVAEAFQESVEQMRSQNARNVLLTAGLAHELRSPLQNLMSASEVALMRSRSPEEYQRVLSDQFQEMQALAMVVDNLITLTALRDTHHLPRRERFDLGLETDLRLDKERAEAARKGVTVTLALTGDLAIDGDREALLLMLRNLVGNAVRWTAPGTEVQVALDGSGPDVVVVVQDQGPGVKTDDRDSIFEAFYQGPAPEGSRVGYGLGLALAKAAVTWHGGEIALESAPDGGARFKVRLSRAG